LNLFPGSTQPGPRQPSRRYQRERGWRIGPPDGGLVNGRLGQPVGRPPIGLADELGQ
jgi:hypothetical protein